MKRGFGSVQRTTGFLASGNSPSSTQWVTGMLLVFCVGLGSVQIEAQAEKSVDPAYEDAGAELLHSRALESWKQVDESVVRYTALVKQRVAAQLRTPLKDRTLYRSETAARVFWDREHGDVVQMLAAREQTPIGVTPPEDFTTAMSDFFDPSGDRLLFGADRDESEEATEAPEEPAEGEVRYWFHHPLHDDATDYYRFASGDTLTLLLAGGERVTAVELRVIPAVADAHRLAGSLWIEPESGALVRAVYRLADRFDVLRENPQLNEEEGVDLVPGLFKPWTFDMEMVLVDYSLWDLSVWLPRTLRVQGVVGAGVLKAPATFEASYAVESVTTEQDLEAEAEGADPIGVFEEHHFETREEAMRFLASLMSEEEDVPVEIEDGAGWGPSSNTEYILPVDPTSLHDSPFLPPPIWEEAPGFPTSGDLEAVEDLFADLPQVNPTRSVWSANWGLERPDLVRFNRVEGPSIGGRFALRTGSPFGPVSLAAEPYFGIGDVEPKLRLSAEWESVRRRTTFGVYRELQSAVRRGDHLGLGNSLTALLWGRDDGEYFLASGADLVFTPPSALKQSWSVRLYGEYHEAVERATDFTVFDAFDDSFEFRENVVADQRAEYGAEVTIRPQWGSDPLAAQFGGELYLHGATGDDPFARASALVRTSVPFSVSSTLWRFSAEVEGGESWGDAPSQRSWYLGGAESLRGYEASSRVDQAFVRSRAELARVFPVVSVALFSDAGWTASSFDDLRQRDGLVSVGLGASVLDGLIRLDVARGLRERRDTRWDFYLDAAF